MAYHRLLRVLYGRRQYLAEMQVRHQHHLRYKQRVESQTPRLVCQSCGGAGGYHEVELEDGSGPDYDCGWCEGTGLLTPHVRGEWLQCMKAMKHDRENSIPHLTIGGYYN